MHSGVSHRSLARIVSASLIGTAIEWYDFFLYSSAAALVFTKLFFPTADPLTVVAVLVARETRGTALESVTAAAPELQVTR
jgi:hypothetical protein